MRRHRNQTAILVLGQARGVPADGPSGDRHRGGVSPAQALVAERGNLRLDVKGALQRGDPTGGAEYRCES
jgi:methyl coenzyme M reductase subunit C